ncbi:MAG: nitrilase family protein [Saprospiraceae bacterium]|nr:nitrilase family protein [Bacteroidia bacterium]NNL90852.1 nitrilase family protein [Saprospiraceae bacterium]
MDKITVTSVQPKLTWHQPELNVEHCHHLIAQSSKTDIIVLPEMWTTGFTMKAHLFKEKTSLGINAMKKWSVEKSALVIGSLIVNENGHYYNRSYAIADGEIIATYDKRHLFTYAGEDRYFTKGHNKGIFEYKGWKISINICYDLRFPIWSRNKTNYDLLIYSANWPDKRIEAWKTLLKARAIENQSFVIGSNCIGEDAWHNTYQGWSTIHDFTGKTLESINGAEGLINSDIIKSEQDAYRNELPFLKDIID